MRDHKRIFWELDDLDFQILEELISAKSQGKDPTYYELITGLDLPRSTIHFRLYKGPGKRGSLAEKDFIMGEEPKGPRGAKPLQVTFKGKLAAFAKDVSNKEVSESLAKHAREFGLPPEAFLGALELFIHWYERFKPMENLSGMSSSEVEDFVGRAIVQGIEFAIVETVPSIRVYGEKGRLPPPILFPSSIKENIKSHISSEGRRTSLLRYLAEEDFLFEAKIELEMSDSEIKREFDLVNSRVIHAGCLVINCIPKLDIADIVEELIEGKSSIEKKVHINFKPIVDVGACPDFGSCKLEKFSEILTCEKVKSDLKKLRKEVKKESERFPSRS